MSVADRFERWTITAILVVILLAAWFVAGTAHYLAWDRVPLGSFLDVTMPALHVIVVAMLFALGWRVRGARTAVEFVLGASIVLVPCLHTALVGWLSVLVHGYWYGDFVGGFRAADFYPQMIVSPRVCSVALALVIGFTLRSVVATRVGRTVALALTVIAAIASLGVSLMHSATRPSLAHWREALPVVMRCPAGRVSFEGTHGPDGIVLARQPSDASLVISVGWRGVPVLPHPFQFVCTPSSEVVVRRVGNGFFAECDPAQGNGRNSRPLPHIATALVIGSLAPPLRWIVAQSIAALLAVVAAQTAWCARPGHSRLERTPYRSFTPPVARPDTRGPLVVLAVVAFVAHANALPLLARWLGFAVDHFPGPP